MDSKAMVYLLAVSVFLLATSVKAAPRGLGAPCSEDAPCDDCNAICDCELCVCAPGYYDSNDECTAQSTVRLVNGAGTSGRVEILVNGTWGTVCDDGFILNNNGAIVVCRMLGYSNGTVAAYEQFGQGTGPILLDDVVCLGTESDILQCSYRILQNSNGCQHEEDVGVICA